MGKNITNFTSGEIADRLNAALEIAFAHFPAGSFDARMKHRHAEIYAKAGVDPSIDQVRGLYCLEYVHELRHAFGVAVEVRVEIGACNSGELVGLSVNWASGPGGLEEAAAAARLHMDACERALIAKVAIKGAFADINYDADRDGHKEALAGGVKIVREAIAAAHEVVAAIYNEMHDKG